MAERSRDGGKSRKLRDHTACASTDREDTLEEGLFSKLTHSDTFPTPLKMP